jgi:DDB1- and CUL4-associated factor 7
MPFGFHTHTSSSSSQHAQQVPGATSGILQAAHNLASIGAPAGNLNNIVPARTTAGTDRLYPSGAPSLNATSNQREQQSVPSATYAPQHANPSIAAHSSSGEMSQSQQFENQKRNRHPDELHLSGPTNMASQRGALSPRDYTPAGPRISLEQAAPESSQYTSAGQLPGSLQPGRPGPITANTAPTVPTMAQEQYSSPSRSSALGISHNYTRSSPAAGFDGQGYTPFTPSTPGGTDQGHFTSPTTQKYTPQSSQRAVSNTPLGLADIRPRADSGLSDGVPGANPYSYDGANSVPTNSNYLAPWAIYAFDWCKWPAQNHDAGKVAVGSYLEDGHNFVSDCSFPSNYFLGSKAYSFFRFKFWTLKLPPHRPSRIPQELQNMDWSLSRLRKLPIHIQSHASCGNRHHLRSNQPIFLLLLETISDSGLYPQKHQWHLPEIPSLAPRTMQEIFRPASLHH